MASWQRVRWSVAVTVFFIMLTAIVLAPLIFHMGTLVAGLSHGEDNYDYFHFHWNLWWLQYAVENGRDIWTTDRVLAPFSHNLTYHSLTASLLPVYLVTEPLVGHQVAANLFLLINPALTGVLMTAFLRRQQVGMALALMGGVALAFSPYMLDHIYSGHLNLIMVFWIPLVLLVWQAAVRRRSMRWALLAGVVLWGMWFTDPLLAFWGGLVLGPHALADLYRAADRRARLHIFGQGAAALAVTLVLAYALGPLRQTLAFDTAFLDPARLLTLRAYALPLKALFFQPGTDDRSLGLLLVGLTWVALFVPSRRSRRWFWLGTGLLSLVLALGPDVTVFDQRVPLPFRIIHELFNGQMRTPARFLPPAMVGLITFLALTFDPYVRRVRRLEWRSLLVGALLLAFLMDFRAFAPMPTVAPPPAHAFDQMIRREHYADYDYVVVDVPSGPYTGWRALGSFPEAMFYGITREKRQVSGLLSRIRLDQHVFYETSPLFGWLTGTQPLDASRVNGELSEVVERWPVGYFVVHQSRLETGRLLETLALFNAHPALCYVEQDGDALLYRTTSHPKGCPPLTPPRTEAGAYRIPLGDVPDAAFIGHGWYWPESLGGATARWAGGTHDALVYADLPPGSAYELSVRAVAFHAPRTVTVTVEDVIDGQRGGTRIGAFTVQPGDWQTYAVTIPADLVARVDGHLVIALSADALLSAADVGLSADTRLLSAAYDWLTLTPQASDDGG